MDIKGATPLDIDERISQPFPWKLRWQLKKSSKMHSYTDLKNKGHKQSIKKKLVPALV